MMETHDQFIASVKAARQFYESVEWPSAEEKRPFLEAILQILKTVPPQQGIEWLQSEMKTVYHPAVAADYEFPLDLVEYCVRSLRWKEGKDMLVEQFNEMKDFSLRLRLELMIKRFYDPHWDDGDWEFTDLGQSIWDLVERKNECRPVGTGEMDTPFKQTHERFLASVSAARNYYVSVIITDKVMASMYLRKICQIIGTVPSSLAIEWLKVEMRSVYHPAVVADYEFPLDLVEYCFRSLRWQEGKEMLVEVFNRLIDPSYKLKIEIIIKRIYDPQWDGGDCEFTDLGPSLWDRIEMHESQERKESAH